MYTDLNTVGSNSFDVDAIKQSLRNIILTQKGSLPGKPYFGSDIHKVIFEQLDPMTERMARGYVESAIREFEPRVKIEDITFKNVEEFNRMVIIVQFSYVDDKFNKNIDNLSIAVNL